VTKDAALHNGLRMSSIDGDMADIVPRKLSPELEPPSFLLAGGRALLSS